MRMARDGDLIFDHIRWNVIPKSNKLKKENYGIVFLEEWLANVWNGKMLNCDFNWKENEVL